MKKLVYIILFVILPQLYVFSQSDNCGGAVALPVNLTCVNTAFTNNENGRPEAGAVNPSCVGGNPGSDVWYAVTGTGGNINVTLSGSNRNATLTIWSNCPATVEIGCIQIISGNSGSIIFPTTAAVTYYVQIQRQSGGDNANMNGDICATNVSSSVPTNDDCAGAISLTVGASCTLTNTSNLNATSSAVPNPGCGSYSGGDVWFSFVAPASGSVNIESFANSLTDGAMALYSGTCGALSLMTCDDDGGAGLMPSIASALTPGQTYYIRFWEFGNNNNGTFGICVVAGVAPSGNQNCTTGTQVCNDASFGGNSDGFATQELNSGNQGCLSTEHQSSWYYFQATTAGTIQLSINPSASIDYDFALWGPNVGCGALGTPLRCSFASGFATNSETGSYSTGLATVVPGAPGNNVGPTDGSGADDLDGWSQTITVAAGETYIMLIDNFTADNTSFTLDWTFSTPGLLNCVPIVLPVDFTEFLGYNLRDYNALNWKTITETNNDYFTIERSLDMENWQIIHTENGAIQSTNELNYSYTDRDFTKNHVNYYRLSQTDIDGNKKELKVISVDNNQKDKTIERIMDITGREINSETKGLQIVIYSDGTSEKIYNY